MVAVETRPDGALSPVGDREAGEDAYFSELLGYSLERLSKEPELLAADQDHLRRKVQDTAVGHYRAVVGAAHCLGALRSQVGAAAGALDALAADLPELQDAAQRFRTAAAAVDERRAANRQLSSSHGALVELLEVPQLMETCIRNASYDEALDLRAFVNKLAVVHGDLPTVRALMGEAEAACGAMLRSLLARLEGAAALPECLRIIGYLRRLAAFSESELRRAFLGRRDAWVAGLLRELDAEAGTPGGYEYLKRLTDVYRLHLFDVVMQYRAIFSDDPAQGGGDAGGGILYEWAQRRVASYLRAVGIHLARVGEGGALASVLDHAMHAGLSLGRVGLDFRPALAPLFERRALEIFAQAVEASTDSLAGLLDAHRWVALPVAVPRPPRPAGDAAPPGAAPPASLVEHTPLAVYLNGLLAALNELRLCAPLLLREPAAELLSGSLMRAAALLETQGSMRTLRDDERAVLESARAAFASTLCPYVAACLERVLPGGGALVNARGAACGSGELEAGELGGLAPALPELAAAGES